MEIRNLTLREFYANQVRSITKLTFFLFVFFLNVSSLFSYRTYENIFLNMSLTLLKSLRFLIFFFFRRTLMSTSDFEGKITLYPYQPQYNNMYDNIYIYIYVKSLIIIRILIKFLKIITSSSGTPCINSRYM